MEITIKDYDVKTKEWGSRNYSVVRRYPNQKTDHEWLTENSFAVVGEIISSANAAQWEIGFVDEIAKDIASKQEQWLYALTIGDQIFKIGETSKSITERFGSYSAGKRKNRQKGTCSTTNYTCSEVIRESLKRKHKIVLYGFKVPTKNQTYSFWGKEKEVVPHVTKYFEKECVQRFKKEFGYKPPL